MKRALSIITILVLVAPAVVFAGTTTRKYHGTIDGGGIMSFKLVTDDGKKKVKNFSFFGASISCQSGSKSYSGVFNFPMRVENGQFYGLGTNGLGGEVRVTGELKRRGRAVGTIKGTGSFVTEQGPGTNCNSGRDEWGAKRA